MSTSAHQKSGCTQQVSKRALVPAVVEPGAKYFAGSVKSFNDHRGFGFLLCEETFACWGRDVYLSKVEAQVAVSEGEAALKEGDHVRFAVVLSEEGYPKAAGVKRLCNSETATQMERCSIHDGIATAVQPNNQASSKLMAQERTKALEEQVQMFASGCAAEHAFPAELSSDERKFVKKVADRLGLPSQSLGMGSDRHIHIFRPALPSAPQPQPQSFAPVEYLVKNTFIDGPVDQEQPAVEPQSLSMPANTFQEALGAEIASSVVFPSDSLATVEESPSIRSIAQSEIELSDSVRERYSFKNTFIHFEEAGSKENGDSRITQSMPAGKFAEGLEEEQAAAAAAAGMARRPCALCEEGMQSDVAVETFPQTPDADAARFQVLSFAAMDGPSFEWPPSSEAIICPPAPVSGAPTCVESPAPAWWGLSPPAMNMLPSTWPALTSVIVVGLTNQPAFNGLRGIISSFDAESGRYNVQLDMGSGKQRAAKLKPENLLPQGQPVIPDVAQPSPHPPSQCRPRLTLDELVV